MFEPLGAVVGHPLPEGIRRSQTKRTGQPVRRHSRMAGREGVFWRPMERKEARRVVLAAKRYELSGRTAGRKNGPLGSVAIEILELFANLMHQKTGRLDPSIDYLMRTLKRSRDAIVRALKALRTHGFLDWLRRYVPTGAEGRGPQVQQTSNAYRLFLPPRAARLLARMGLMAPIPDDHAHREQQRQAEIEAQRAELSELERTLMDVDPDTPLGAALMRMAQARASQKQRESARRSESLC